MTTTDEPPVWLLDVDGVINADKPGWGAAPRKYSVTDQWGSTWVLRWAPALITRIGRIHAEGRDRRVHRRGLYPDQVKKMKAAIAGVSIRTALAIAGGCYVLAAVWTAVIAGMMIRDGFKGLAVAFTCLAIAVGVYGALILERRNRP